MTRKQFYLALISVLAVVASTACSTVPPEQFYTLGSTQQRAPALSSIFNRDVIVFVTEIPEIINRPEIAVFTSQNQLTILDNDRWAEPVKSAINNLLARNLSSALPNSWVAKAALDQHAKPIKVMVRIDAMDARLPGKVVLVASWVINDGDNKLATKGRLSLERTVDQNAKPIDIVNAWSEQLNDISTAIAQAIIQ
jgi:uncharacterized lipoprotein YmbA